jgi:hypothetical protein
MRTPLKDPVQLAARIAELEATVATMRKGDVPAAITELIDLRAYVGRLKNTISSLENHRDQVLLELNTARGRLAAHNRPKSQTFGDVTEVR